MFDNQLIHTEHRDVIHDCSYDYYGQVNMAVLNNFEVLTEIIYVSAHGDMLK